jgi:hypothetical protein
MDRSGGAAAVDGTRVDAAGGSALGVKANIDLIAVGPAGVVVIDVKNWRTPTPDAAAVATLRAARRCVEDVLPAGISPVVMRAMLVFVGHDVNERVGEIALLGASGLAARIAGLPMRLRPEDVEQVAKTLDAVLPQHVRAAEPGPALTLFDVYEALAAHARSARQGPIEEWMTYLSPEQHAVVRREFAGPARVSGYAGTGKTVVGLHRAARLASRGEGTVLFLTFVRSTLLRRGGSE